ncbi:MAG: transposase [Atopobiaceae bacterium]|nr:transposase [Atopobiaceae bacterium]
MEIGKERAGAGAREDGLGRRRSVDVETIFGDIKRNWGFRRFLLRGLEKVDHEMRMVAMGHNTRKMAYALGV